jgi:glycerophosphoryl diester phosphodiesterase
VGTLRQAELAALGAKPFAHRGLHGNGTPENSLAAFRAAVAGGFGIELDVQLSGDGEAMVFHDDRLERLTATTGAVADRSAAELGAIRLRGSGETIPTLAEAIEAIAGAPLLIELKAPNRHVRPLCEAVARALASYMGPVGVMSFNPEVAHWFEQPLRGLVISESGKRGWRGRVERRLALWRARPDFLAYDVRDLPSAFARAAGRPVYTWTVRTEADRARAAAHADQIIFENPPA